MRIIYVQSNIPTATDLPNRRYAVKPRERTTLRPPNNNPDMSEHHTWHGMAWHADLGLSTRPTTTKHHMTQAAAAAAGHPRGNRRRSHILPPAAMQSRLRE